MNVTVFGAGTWGTTVANQIAKNVSQVKVWARDDLVVENINNLHCNPKFLPDIPLNPNIIATGSIKEALQETSILIWAIPIQYTRERLMQCMQYLPQNIAVINLSKGFEAATCMRPSQVISEIFGECRVIGSLGGPNIASEINNGNVTVSSIAFNRHGDYSELLDLFKFTRLKVELCHDLVGIEVAGAIKNMIAIAAGMCDGLLGGANIKALAISRGYEELMRVVSYYGGNPINLGGPYGLGDMLTTCYSHDSRNRRFGYGLGKGKSPEESLTALNGRVAEGISTCQAWDSMSSNLIIHCDFLETIKNIVLGRFGLSCFKDMLLNFK